MGEEEETVIGQCKLKQAQKNIFCWYLYHIYQYIDGRGIAGLQTISFSLSLVLK